MDRYIVLIVYAGEVQYIEAFSQVYDHYEYPSYTYRMMEEVSPVPRYRAFPRTGDKRFGGWSC